MEISVRPVSRAEQAVAVLADLRQTVGPGLSPPAAANLGDTAAQLLEVDKSGETKTAIQHLLGLKHGKQPNILLGAFQDCDMLQTLNTGPGTVCGRGQLWAPAPALEAFVSNYTSLFGEQLRDAMTESVPASDIALSGLRSLAAAHDIPVDSSSAAFGDKRRAVQAMVDVLSPKLVLHPQHVLYRALCMYATARRMLSITELSVNALVRDHERAAKQQDTQ